MPRQKLIQKLKELCWLTLIHFFGQIKQQAEYLPPILINELYQRCCEDCHFTKELPANLFIRSTTKKLGQLKLFGLSEDEVVKIIRKTCTRLQKIRLRFDFIDVISNNRRLVCLELCESDVSNNDLAIIATQCPKLQYLDLSDCKCITDNGMQYLPTNLTHLNLFGTNVTEKGCIFALNSLKLLKEFMHRNWIEILQVLSKEDGLKTFSIEKLEIVIHKQLHFKICDVAADLFPKLRDFEIICSSFHTPSVGRLTSNINYSLTILNVQQFPVGHLIEVGHFFPMLKELFFIALNEDPAEENKLPPAKHLPFKHLRKLCLEVDHSIILKEDFMMLFENCHGLEEFRISHCNEDLNEIISGILAVNPLHHLKSFSFSCCLLLSIQTIITMVKLLRSINRVNILFCKNICWKKFRILDELIKDNNWDINLTMKGADIQY